MTAPTRAESHTLRFEEIATNANGTSRAVTYCNHTRAVDPAPQPDAAGSLRHGTVRPGARHLDRHVAEFLGAELHLSLAPLHERRLRQHRRRHLGDLHPHRRGRRLDGRCGRQRDEHRWRHRREARRPQRWRRPRLRPARVRRRHDERRWLERAPQQWRRGRRRRRGCARPDRLRNGEQPQAGSRGQRPLRRHRDRQEQEGCIGSLLEPDALERAQVPLLLPSCAATVVPSRARRK